MGVEIPVGFAQCNIIMRHTAKVEDMVMTLGVFPGIGMDAGDIAQAVHNALVVTGSLFTASRLPSMVSGWTYNGVNTTLMDVSGPVLGSFPALVAGTASSPGLVINGSLLVKKNTAAGGRKNRGRCFMPPAFLQEVAVEVNGVINNTIRTAEQTAWSNFHAALGTEDVPPQLFHSEIGLSPTPITSFTVENVIATQRRRLR